MAKNHFLLDACPCDAEAPGFYDLHLGVSKTWGGVLACPGLIGLADA